MIFLLYFTAGSERVLSLYPTAHRPQVDLTSIPLGLIILVCENITIPVTKKKTETLPFMYLIITPLLCSLRSIPRVGYARLLAVHVLFT